MKTPMKTEEIREIREKLGLTQEEIAQKIQTTLSQYMGSKTKSKSLKYIFA